jgi:hypothetical protein
MGPTCERTKPDPPAAEGIGVKECTPSVTTVTNPNEGGSDANAPANGDVVEFVGAAAPVVTPFVANLLTPYGTMIVNKP